MAPKDTIHSLGIHYRIVEDQDGFSIFKYNGDVMIGLMGITSTKTKAERICKRLMDGLTRNDWD